MMTRKFFGKVSWVAVVGFLLGARGGRAGAAEFLVSSGEELREAVKRVAPGDVIVLKSGVWKDVDLLLRGRGTVESPITLRAEEPGKVILEGTSRLRIGGEHWVVEGLWFRNPQAKEGMVVFRENAKIQASRCVLRHCAITQDGELAEQVGEQKWVSIYGEGNVVERCHFAGKTSKGTLLVVWLPEKAGDPVRHQIERNYFGPRPRLGSNGGEIIRIGDSATSMQWAECVVEGNWFESCDGEVECISNKSCGNVYRHNRFVECQGTLTLRHGNGCVVEGNLFLGGHRKETGGIRVIGEDHEVRGNYLSGLEGDEARSALCLMNGMVDSPLHGYFPVKRALLRDNVILDCKVSVLIGFADKDVKAPLPPVDCELVGNYVFSGRGRLVEVLDTGAGLVWRDNILGGPDPGVPAVDGIRREETRREPPLPAVPAREETGAGWWQG